MGTAQLLEITEVSYMVGRADISKRIAVTVKLLEFTEACGISELDSCILESNYWFFPITIGNADTYAEILARHRPWFFLAEIADAEFGIGF